MPIDYTRYPDNWSSIRERILWRARDRCEHCSVRNHAVGYRNEEDEFMGVAETHLGHVINGHKVIRIVLTIAHLYDPDPSNVANDNLAALCQRCHNRLDMPMRIKNAAETRRQRQIDAGQLVMPLEAHGESK